MRTFSQIKATVLAIVILLVGYQAEAQNVFPVNGNVGLNTNTPARQLHLISSNGLARFQSKTQNGWLEFFNNSGYNGYLGTYTSARDMDFGTGATNAVGSVHIVTQARPKLTVTQPGNVGIGTTSPTRKLHISGTNGLARFQSTNNDGWLEFFNAQGYNGYIGTYLGNRDMDFGTSLANTTGKLNLITKGAARLVIDPNGNTGIGTTSPTRKLHISGTNGLVRLQSTNNDSWLEFFNAQGYNGYIGTYLGNRDMDFGTSLANTTGKLNLITKGAARMVIDPNGNVGIGTSTPSEKLHVRGNVFISSAHGNVTYGYQNGDRFQFSTIGGGENLQLRSISDAGTTRMVAYFQQNGAVGINTNDIPSAYKLAVDGRIICEELNVQLSSAWPDYVFEEDYDLRSLNEVASYIDENGHLPGVPSAQSLEQGGSVEIGEMQRIMMEKIEELTLYMIDLKKENESLKAEVATLKKAQK